jgi:hypothetical protein
VFGRETGSTVAPRFLRARTTRRKGETMELSREVGKYSYAINP